MVSMAAARRVALSLPETTEEPHHDLSSFRVDKKIFATVPDGTHLHVMVDEGETAMAVAACPSGCEELWWGKRLSGVRVDLTQVDRELLTELLTESWRRRAPKALLARLEK
ncbi:MAG TPA: MmcQ/YjbR family DNA-binding protein [Acidimicrobiales bacterium]|nr:MmcQ/YjbR family DNA-binding protein [Acidimicrobiales bacterium]